MLPSCFRFPLFFDPKRTKIDNDMLYPASKYTYLVVNAFVCFGFVVCDEMTVSISKFIHFVRKK